MKNKTNRLSRPFVLALALAVALLLGIGWQVGATSIVRDLLSFSGDAQPRAATWGDTPASIENLQTRSPEEYVYLELIEENTDTFEEPLFAIKPRILPAPYLFEDEVLRVDTSLIQASDPDLGIFIESGRSRGREILLVHWNYYNGVGRYLDGATYYVLNEPSGSVSLPYYNPSDTLHYTPFDSLVDTLQVRLLPGQSFRILEAGEDGSVQFALDGKTFEFKPGEHHVLSTQTHVATVTELTPYDKTVDYGEVTFTTKTTLYNYGSPKAIEFINANTVEGGE